MDVLQFSIRLVNNEYISYRYTGLEIAQGGPEGFRYFLRTIESDIRARCERYGGYTTTRTGMWEGRTREEIEGHLMWLGVDWAAPEKDTAAEKRAQDLFLMACGKEAFDTLNAGKPLAVTGSKGTSYTLHRRATYCVERKKDNTKLCAVVPGVPLWDHLLGIKLMIENDEPAFLKTANVARDYASEQEYRSPYHRIRPTYI